VCTLCLLLVCQTDLRVVGLWWGCNGHSQHGAGYAFVEFKTRETAEHMLKTYDGQPIASTHEIVPHNCT
jgi:hypothetical protein